jgi:putative acetyltransferase
LPPPASPGIRPKPEKEGRRACRHTAPLMDLQVRVEDPTSPELRTLLQEHLADMRRRTPPGRAHALEVDALRSAEITVWAAWCGTEIAGCGALRELDERHGEIKSMRTASSYLRRGVGARILAHIVEEARSRGYRSLSLETGSTPAFEKARSFYARTGFAPCGPFGGYAPDPHSFFMTREL